MKGVKIVTMAIDGNFLLDKSKVMRSIKNIGHLAILASLHLQIAIATVTHLLIELPIEEKCNQLWN